MNRNQYILELTKELGSLPEPDRKEAVSFYEEYLSEIEENDPTKLSDLEPPRKIGAQIKAEMAIKKTNEKDIKKKKGLATTWTVLLAIFALPVGLPIAITIAAVAVAMIVVALSLIIALFAVSFSLIISGLVALVSAITLAATNLSVSLFYLGMSLLGLGLGYLMGIAVYSFSKNLFIWIAKLINKVRLNIQNRQRHKEGVE